LTAVSIHFIHKLGFGIEDYDAVDANCKSAFCP
jgi:hypothetical protein